MNQMNSIFSILIIQILIAPRILIFSSCFYYQPITFIVPIKSRTNNAFFQNHNDPSINCNVLQSLTFQETSPTKTSTSARNLGRHNSKVIQYMSCQNNELIKVERREFLKEIRIVFMGVHSSHLLQKFHVGDNRNPTSHVSEAWALSETIGKDPNCNDGTCLGVWDGLLADCPHMTRTEYVFGNGGGCVSSQDDTPGIFAEPWDYSEYDNYDWNEQQKQLLTVLDNVCIKLNEKLDIITRDGRYLRVHFMNNNNNQIESIGEFYYTPNDTTVQFRIASAVMNSTNNNIINTDGLVTTGKKKIRNNNERAEMIRKDMKYLKLTVLRNRKRSLFFVESDLLDTFGPSSIESTYDTITSSQQ